LSDVVAINAREKKTFINRTDAVDQIKKKITGNDKYLEKSGLDLSGI